MKKIGSLEIITGPMFAGKTEELIRRLRREKIAKERVELYKPQENTRDPGAHISSHNGMAFPAKTIKNILDIRTNPDNATIIGIDEIQFFEFGKNGNEIPTIMESIFTSLLALIIIGVDIIISGLDADFRGKPFETVSRLILYPESTVTYLTAICISCGNKNARWTHKISGDASARFEAGAADKYVAVCGTCHPALGGTYLK